MLNISEAGEPQKLEFPLSDLKKSSVETFEVVSDVENVPDFEFVSDVEIVSDIENVSDEQAAIDCWNEFAERLEALEKRADKPTFSMEYSSSELNAVGKEVSKLAELGRIYLRLAYVKYLLAVGLNVDDANFLADNVDCVCRQNTYSKVAHAECALRYRHLLAI